MKLRFVILTSFIVASSNIYGQTIKKCDVAIVLFTKNKMGQLTQREIRSFLLTFGQECRNNVEYIEFSNEILFDLLDKQTELLLKTMKIEENKIEMNIILEDLGMPINDEIDVRSILSKVEKVNVSGQIKNDIVDRLNSAIKDMN
ncbi:MAG: hypothetical protein ABL895_01255 [Cyclobacteriaceae bacterium]